MEFAITKLSQNGQVVIPSEIRKDANLAPSTKFIVFNQGGNILLKQVTKEALLREMQLAESILRSEEEIAKGKVTRVNAKMSDNEIDSLLMD
ncbi:AbrB/MazE/SpoVT family DNA-binding domain-containing protein [Candidatus Woesearchaeota archaeon]|jgi:AbrB family looped-hinge helix DNA binding protein|nr:AbrB/MazE/SpoVT family DNA-binding domain-containing protein [Candidatus Woesearchaeota archaeon]MBT7367108.1 AbrB/MazE/SpoVT family DNA-binding domain-containing protein [Candidatus Woesearchaeota archaeon]